MRLSPAVFNTDQVNRYQMLCPASELMKAEQQHQRECLNLGCKPGMPVNMQHDMHRLIGWTRPIGLYADSLMVRVLGLIEKPETEDEKAALATRAEEYWAHHHGDGPPPFQNELISRASPASVVDARFLLMAAAVLERGGIANHVGEPLVSAAW